LCQKNFSYLESDEELGREIGSPSIVVKVALNVLEERVEKGHSKKRKAT
jgi:hypothetical protein